MTGEILGHRHGVAAMAFHAQRQSLQAAQGEEAVEGTLNGADGVLHKGKLIGQSGVVADHQDAADHVGVAVEVLRGRMHEDRKSTRLNSSPYCATHMPSSA